VIINCSHRLSRRIIHPNRQANLITRSRRDLLLEMLSRLKNNGSSRAGDVSGTKVKYAIMFLQYGVTRLFHAEMRLAIVLSSFLPPNASLQWKGERGQ
jgi:hypothetical protein